MQNNRRPQQNQRRPSQRPAQGNYRGGQARMRAQKKKRRTQILALGVIVLLILIIAVSCGGGEDTTALNNNSVSSDAGVANSTSTQEPINASDIFPIVVYDSNNVKITLTGYKADGLLGDEIEYTFENNASKTIMLGIGDAYINGWKITTLGGNTLPAGMRTNGIIYLSSDDMEKSGITDFNSISLKECSIWEDETYNTIDTFDIAVNLG